MIRLQTYQFILLTVLNSKPYLRHQNIISGHPNDIASAGPSSVSLVHNFIH